jgi:hypothetical protein
MSAGRELLPGLLGDSGGGERKRRRMDLKCGFESLDEPSRLDCGLDWTPYTG